MRDQHYKNRTIRAADKTWERIKEKRRKSGKSWNLFLVDLMRKKEKGFDQKKPS